MVAPRVALVLGLVGIAACHRASTGIRPVQDAAKDLAATYAAARRLGLRVVAVEVLPWNNGYPQAAPLITQLNGLIHRAARAAGIPVAPWFRALEDPVHVRLTRWMMSRYAPAGFTISMSAPSASSRALSRSASRAFATGSWCPARSPKLGAEATASRNGP